MTYTDEQRFSAKSEIKDSLIAALKHISEERHKTCTSDAIRRYISENPHTYLNDFIVNCAYDKRGFAWNQSQEAVSMILDNLNGVLSNCGEIARFEEFELREILL